jgi:LysM repeat protein
MTFDVVTAKDPIDMKALAKALNISYEALRDLNPAYKTQYIPQYSDTVAVRVPAGRGKDAEVALGDAIVKNKRLIASVTEEAVSKSFVRYKVRRGDSLEKIAEQFDVTVADILKINRIRKNRIRPGSTLRIPGNASYLQNRKPTVAAQKVAEKSVAHTVKRGETLTRIARRFGVSLTGLAKKNGISTRSRVVVGQRILIPSET